MPDRLKIQLPPKSFYVIFFLEFWERFGFYGVQAIIVLYMIQKLNYSDKEADILFASFNALIYLLPCIGGYIGDHVLGIKRTIVFGALVLGLGYFVLAMTSTLQWSLYPALALIAVGVGFFKANPSNLVSQLYRKAQLNSDSGFTLYYMAINSGALVSMSLTPILYKHWGWSFAFFICFLGMLLGIWTFIFGRKWMVAVGSKPDFQKISAKSYWHVLFLFAVLGISAYWLLRYQSMMFWLLILGGSGFIGLFIYQMKKASSHEKKGMLLFLILFFQAILFFILYFQPPTSLTLYAIRNVNHSLFGLSIEPASFQALNSFWVMVLSPVLAFFYQYLHNKNKDFSMPAKFAWGMLFAGFGFLVLPLGGLFANSYGIVSSNWLVFSYFLQSLGELLISALGLSLAAQYIPQRYLGFTMGLWFLGTSIGSRAAGSIAALADIPRHLTDPLQSLPIYNQLFLKLGLVTVSAGFLMAIFVPKLKKLAENPRLY